MRNSDESEDARISNAKREPFDPLRPAHVIEIVEKAMGELYDPNRPVGSLYVRCIINRACEAAFRKALRLSENEVAKQLADAQEEINEMLIMIPELALVWTITKENE
jgi:hypothetical protein